MQAEGLTTLSALQDRILHDRPAWERFLQGVSVNVSAIFRDPRFFLTFRRVAVPLLRTYPFIRIWQAGCSTARRSTRSRFCSQRKGCISAAAFTPPTSTTRRCARRATGSIRSI